MTLYKIIGYQKKNQVKQLLPLQKGGKKFELQPFTPVQSCLLYTSSWKQ